MLSKKEIRKSVKALVKAIPADARTAEALAVTNRLLSHPKVQSAATIALFASLPDEIDTTQMIETLAENASVVLPRLDGDNMDFYPYSPQSMHSGAMGISEGTLVDLSYAVDENGIKIVKSVSIVVGE